MATTSAILTVAEFARLPQPSGGVRLELRHGEVIELPPVKKLHTRIQKRLVSLLEAHADPSAYLVDKEFPFRPAAEHEVWIADVALYSRAAWDSTPDDDYFRGVPALVVEVLSPSNTASEMLEREELCLGSGGLEFWLVDPARQTIKIIRASGQSVLLHTAGQIESTLLTAPIPVRRLFE
ncbi:MAG: Uma2 family endonuclease [Bryobacteraceae bacterium]|nr:Uma2 family endonuclease [Bryobacteraceae bacterium]